MSLYMYIYMKMYTITTIRRPAEPDRPSQIGRARPAEPDRPSRTGRAGPAEPDRPSLKSQKYYKIQ